MDMDEQKVPPRVVLNYQAIAAKMLKGAAGNSSGSKDLSPIANVSALAPAGDDLWTGSDEGLAIERLKRDSKGYGRARSWELAELFPAFAAARKKAGKRPKRKKKREADLEGLAFDPDTRRLWIVGSHCRGRGSMDHVKVPALRKSVASDLHGEPLRTLLGFVPLAPNGEPEAGKGLALPLGDKPGSLRAAIADDDGHLADSLRWPSKENGFDIEGIAVKDCEVLLGLRGPAVGGFALVMRLSLKLGAKELSLRKRAGARYGLSYLQLNGLGVRDLFRMGDDVLVLAGPTMDLDAPFALYRWRNAFARPGRGDEIIRPDGARLEFLFDFARPTRVVDEGRPRPHERPEGIAVVGKDALLVVHDRPCRQRLQPRGTLKADRIDWSSSRRPLV
jgi:hypothetical protein